MKRTALIALLLAIALMLCGCKSWMDGSYQSIKPHQQAETFVQVGAVQVSSYTQLYQALCNMVAAGSEERMFYITEVDQDLLSNYLKIASESVIASDPIGAFAVEKIDFEVGTHTGRAAVAVTVQYRHNRSEILKIKRVGNMEEAGEAIYQALATCDPNVVVMVEQYRQADFVQQVEDYVESNPQICMEMPQVSAAVYPESGTRRVVELNFTYQNSRDDLRQMQSYVEPIFRAANLNVSGEEEEATKFSRMYSFLMERTDYRQETSLTPTYSLLRHGVGDSRAVARVYAAMCREAQLECTVITGSRNGEPWTWNLVCCDGVYYHVDLLSSLSAGRLIRWGDAEMQGYVWDYDAYPAAGAVHIPEPTETQPVEPETQPQETAPTEAE